MNKRCIFHYPSPITDNPNTGSALRPYMMLNAFKNIGYEVDAVIGYGQSRKQQIKRIKNNIKNGIKYDFIYSESLTIPTLLSEKNHIPKYPFLDFSFFRFCKKNGIGIGLFYRDMYWKFPIYKNSVSFWKKAITVPLYKYDLIKYKKLVDRMYVPTKEIQRYAFENEPLYELPPGSVFVEEILKYRQMKEEGERLQIIYVGGMNALYDLTGLYKAVQEIESVELTICTTVREFELFKERLHDVKCDRIHIIHKTSKELASFYKRADIAALYFNNNVYRDIAMPIKMFEYIGYGLPIIANSRTVAANFIEKEDIGWIVDYDHENIKKLLLKLSKNKDSIKHKTERVISIVKENTWESRALKVSEDLK